jgi:hypothetical protein
MKRLVAAIGAVGALAALPAIADGHEVFDHPAPFAGPVAAPSLSAQAGPPGARWEFVTSIATGNPHTDLDFFRSGGETFLSAGTLGVAPNGGGQTIMQLTSGGQIAPRVVAQAPTASCAANEAAALGLQHDVEASPKTGDAQIVVDATDAQGRCHDSRFFGGVSEVGVSDKRGGLEIIDVTDPGQPVEIGLTSHIGEAHTVNVDPRRPHIAYAVTSDSVTVAADGTRSNDQSGYDLDGFEVVDMSSCMYFPKGTSVQAKRDRCRPQVFRYRYPDVGMAQGHTNKSTLYGCHELEVYPDDRLTCGSGGALVVLDMKGAFDDNGTPTYFRDDRLRGTPLPCTVRPSASAVFTTGAMVTDCATENLTVSQYTTPSLAGVEHVGSVYHMGREDALGATTPDFGADEDIDFNHEAEYSHSRRLLIATDERGGGVLPTGASCATAADNKSGNGGVHFYRADALRTTTPATAEEAHEAYARTPSGEKAIYRVPIRTGAQATVCTAHVFQQIPGQNRIFMAWYSQGTQVLDFVENADGTVTLKEAGFFIPANANQWVSHVFKSQRNADGTWTYWGAAADFNLGERGRNAIDIWKVTLPAPPKPR